jgi:hypothetical protein
MEVAFWEERKTLTLPSPRGRGKEKKEGGKKKKGGTLSRARPLPNLFGWPISHRE